MNFELRDGLAYKPEIAVFDEGFSHLEPIARNTDAIIMHIDEFMRLLGLEDNH
jgi:ABC-type proline/glycine betaine transport system ATPase subunit